MALVGVSTNCEIDPDTINPVGQSQAMLGVKIRYDGIEPSTPVESYSNLYISSIVPFSPY
jgi:hypothetical protein